MSGNAISCGWCSENLLAGCREELSEPDSRSLTTHLTDCPDCRDEQGELLTLQDAFAAMPEIEPAADSYQRLQSLIEDEAPPAGDANAGQSRRGVLLAFAGAMVAAAAAFILFVGVLAPPSPAPLTPLAGSLTMDGVPLEPGLPVLPVKGTRIAAHSLALLSLAAPRKIELTLGRGTTIECRSEGRFRMHSGRILAQIAPGDETITFTTEFGTVEVTGTVFDLDLTGGNLTLSVLEGTVSLRTGKSPVRVDSGMAVTVMPGGIPGAPERIDPSQIRNWCSSPTARLEAIPGRLRLTLRNETVRPLVVKPYDPAVGVYSLRIESADGPEDLKLQEAMIVTRRPAAPRSRSLTLAPGEEYVIVLDPDRLGLSAGRYRISAVYNPYTKDLPEGTWRGVLISPPADLEVR